MTPVRLVIDDKIPYIKGVFEPCATVEYLSPVAMTPDTVKNADALMIRTRTKCDRKLLDRSDVKFIATATIGFDHIDTRYCRERHIAWANAPGCNAASVGQYILSSLLLLASGSENLKGKSIGIIGAGHVGTIVARYCRLFGMQVLLNDPPRADREGPRRFSSLDEIAAQCDFITFHTPLNREGDYPTWHLGNMDFFRKLKKRPVLFNTARGEITDTESLLLAHREKLISGLVIDCWENEPDISPALLELAIIATPHIAGYSADGKSNASRMAAAEINRFFSLQADLDTIVPPVPSPHEIDLKGAADPVAEAVLATYNPLDDTRRLRQNPERFEEWRGNYPLRREFKAYTVRRAPASSLPLLKELGFTV